jgi:hypothetical protein
LVRRVIEALRSRKVVIASVIALLLLAAVGVGVFLLTSDRDSPSASSETVGSSGSAEPAPPSSGTPAPGQPPASPGPGSGPPDEVANAKQVAEQAITAINAHDAEAMTKLSCDPEAIGPAETLPPESRVELVAAPDLTGDAGTAELKLIFGDQSTSLPLPLRKQNGAWCVD